MTPSETIRRISEAALAMQRSLQSIRQAGDPRQTGADSAEAFEQVAKESLAQALSHAQHAVHVLSALQHAETNDAEH